MKVVLDTNVLLAAMATHGLCELVLSVCLQHHSIVISDPILDEFRGHLVGKFKMPVVQADEIVKFILDGSRLVVPADIPPAACRDPSDLMVLGTAIAGGAECIVTGDKDLLVIQNFGAVAILSPRAFYERCSG